MFSEFHYTYIVGYTYMIVHNNAPCVERTRLCPTCPLPLTYVGLGRYGRAGVVVSATVDDGLTVGSGVVVDTHVPT